jgi:hypothetical protein
MVKERYKRREEEEESVNNYGVTFRKREKYRKFQEEALVCILRRSLF